MVLKTNRKVKEMKDAIVGFIPTIAKAIAGAVVGFIVTFFAQQGVVVDDATQNALVAGLSGLIVGFVVYKIPNKK